MIYRINDVDFYSLEDDRFDRHFGKDSRIAYEGDIQDLSPNLVHPCSQIAQYLAGGTFYFSHTIDLSQTLRSTKATDWSADNVRSEYFWNSFMMRPIMFFLQQLSMNRQSQLHKSGIFVHCINGYFGFKQVGQDMDLILLSRLSSLRAGTRLLSRGLDDDGNVSNFAETEMIIRKGDVYFSFLIIRGSVPVFWDQQGQRLGYPKVQVTRAALATRAAFDRHIEHLNKAYGLIHAIDLLDQREGKSEQVLSQAYEYHCKAYPDKNIMSLTKFDMNSIVKIFDYHRLEALFHLISRDIQLFGFSVFQAGQNLREQKGVFRINCLDCVDRTNVVQSFLAFKTAELFFRSFLGQNMPSDFLDVMRSLWAENGDKLSYLYSGTSAQRSTYTRSGRYGFSDVLSDVKKTFARLYQSNFKDFEKQESIDILLGKQAHQEVIDIHDPLAGKIKAELEAMSERYSEIFPLNVVCATWNTGGLVPSSLALIDKLVDNQSTPDMFVIGLQEIVSLNATQVMEPPFIFCRSCHPTRRKSLFGRIYWHRQ